MAFRSHAEETNSLIGPASSFEGKFYVNGSLTISGKFEGELKVEEAVIITDSGRVKTNIVARKVTVGGVLIGNIDATEEVNLLSTGRVMGNITAPVINIQKGSVTKGEVSVTGGQNQDIDKLIQASWTDLKASDLPSSTKKK